MADNSGSDQTAALGSALRMIRRDIDRAIAPEAHSALAKDTITSLTLILDELADYFSSDADPEAERSRAGIIEGLATAPATEPSSHRRGIWMTAPVSQEPYRHDWPQRRSPRRAPRGRASSPT